MANCLANSSNTLTTLVCAKAAFERISNPDAKNNKVICFAFILPSKKFYLIRGYLGCSRIKFAGLFATDASLGCNECVLIYHWQ